MGRSDEELLAASRRGEREAFGALVERYQGVVCAVSYSRTGNRALSEDVAQDTFLAAWRQLDKLREATRLRAWLCGIARNLARKARLRTEREAPTETLSTTFEGANPFDQMAEVETDRLVRDALTRVPETYRDVLVLYYREHRSVRDVSRLLDISEDATLQRLSRGRQYLTDGVTDLVERSLRGHVQKSLVVGVLAAIALAPSHASAATHAKGSSMIKIALLGTIVAAGTATVVVHPWSKSTASTPVTATTGAYSAPPPAPALPSQWKMPTVHQESPLPPVPPGAKIAARPDEMPLLDRDQIEKAKLEHGPAKGNAKAPVTITVFTDMLCTYCASSLGTIDQLMEEYPNKVRLVMKQMPVHRAAEMPAEANYAADAQGKFWEMHDLMAQHPDALPRELVEQLAQQAGLDMTKFDAALANGTYKAAVQADLDMAKDIEITGTPAFVINGRRVIGNLPIEVMRSAIDDALAHAQM
ncbi:MAG TPA: sigma-70 family RNA polymerase sigma factor [Kofleriaceae bacterium]